MFFADTPILIVDDMPTMRKLIARVCTEAGFSKITETADLGSAWSAITNAEPKFGLAIVDFNMGSSNSLDLLRRIRSDSRFKLLPFLMLTVPLDMEHEKEIMESGADYIQSKPFNAADFTEKLGLIRKKRTDGNK